jgi:general secretion pathway protein G
LRFDIPEKDVEREFLFAQWSPSMKHPQRRDRPTRGFTLIEIVIVLVILAGIMAIVGPRVFGGLGKAQTNQAKVKIEQIANQLDMFKLEVGRYPTEAEGLKALVNCPSGLANCTNGYLKDAKMLLDPWQKEFRYTVSGSKYEISSLGADGKEGGTGEDADIKSGS